MLDSKEALEDISFLESQRTDRAAKMVNHDTNYDRNVIKHTVKKRKNDEFVNNTIQNDVAQFKTVTDTHNEADVDKQEGDIDYNENISHKKSKSETITVEIPRKLFQNPELVGMLDKTQTGSRKAIGMAALLLKSTGADLSDFSISRAQVHRQRDKCRPVLAQLALDEFNGNKSEHSLAHWDSKLVDDAHGTKLKRLAA